MKYHFTLKIDDPDEKLEHIPHDYCIPVANRMIEEAVTKAKNQRMTKYSDDKIKIIRMCAPDERELRESLEDIVNYYEKYFGRDEAEGEQEIKIIVRLHEYLTIEEEYVNGHKKDEPIPAYAVGNTIRVGFFNIIDMVLDFNKWRIEDDKKHTVEYQIVKAWKENTKQIFFNQLRYYMAHEIYHVLQGFELKKAGIRSNNKLYIVNEIFAEYFALAYINDFCNTIEANYCNTVIPGLYGTLHGTLNLCETAYFSEEDRRSGSISKGLVNSANMFYRKSGDNGALCSGDYYGGAFLLALAIVHRCKSFGKQDPFYTELNAIVMENRADDALEKIVLRKGEARKWLEIISRGNENYYKEEENC